jgi:hypothetical protein
MPPPDEADAGGDSSLHALAVYVQGTRYYRRGVLLTIAVHVAAIAADGDESPEAVRAAALIVRAVANGLFCGEFAVGYLAAVRKLPHLTSLSSLAEFGMTLCGVAGSLGGPAVLGAIPAARLLRLAAQNSVILELLKQAGAGAWALAQLLLVSCVVFAVVGTAGRGIFTQGEGAVELGFGSLTDALLTSFQLLTGDGWR